MGATKIYPLPDISAEDEGGYIVVGSDVGIDISTDPLIIKPPFAADRKGLLRRTAKG